MDYAQLVKLYGTVPEAAKGRYSPAECVSARKQAVTDRPEKAHVSTSRLERHNLTMMVSMRQSTRFTNAFSKRAENHGHSLALYFM